MLSKALGAQNVTAQWSGTFASFRRRPGSPKATWSSCKTQSAWLMSSAGERLSVPAMVALFTGMRLGQVLALRFVPNRLKWFAFFRGGEGRRPGPS